jgi:hypothetical protein
MRSVNNIALFLFKKYGGERMPLKPGHTNNPNGRPKGRSNKATTEMRGFLNRFIKRNRKKLQEDWDQLTAYQRVQMLEKLLAFTTPKMNSFEVEQLPDAQLDELLNKIIEHNERQIQFTQN